MAQRDTLLGELSGHNQRCSNVEEGSSLVEECRNKQALLLDLVYQFNMAVDEFNSAVEKAAQDAQQRTDACAAIARKVQADRQAIEQQISTNAMSQEELQNWSKLNKSAQVEALADAARFVFGEFVADLDPYRDSVTKLENQAAFLTKKSIQSKKYATRMRYLADLNAVRDQLAPMQVGLLAKNFSNTALDVDEVWELSRDTMQHEFRVARKQDEHLREALKDPEFHDAFVGDEMDQPGLEVISDLMDEAVQSGAKLLVGLERYERFAGPTVRAAVFVRDASYDALLFSLSKDRMLQQSELAGALAKSARVLQEQNQKDVDALRACQAEGSSQ
jgi:hypothetical protein